MPYSSMLQAAKQHNEITIQHNLLNYTTMNFYKVFALIHTQKINVNKIVRDNNYCAKIIFNIV